MSSVHATLIAMTKKRYGKLVRDKVPELIRANGEIPTIRTMDTDEYRRELLYKLIEEAEEVRKAGYDASDSKFVKELADLQEVFIAVIEEFDIDETALEAARKNKLEERGGYDERVFEEDGRDE